MIDFSYKRNAAVDGGDFIYLDNMATTACDALVIDAMYNVLGNKGVYANPSSHHPMGKDAAKIVADAAEIFADCIGATKSSITWTSGATEANNLAIYGAVKSYTHKGKHVITVATEHKAVLEVFASLVASGYEVEVLPVNSDGLLDLDLLASKIRLDTVLVSVMLVNNEIGVIQDIATISNIVKKYGALLHVDAAQGIGKTPINVNTLGCDLMSFSAHKFYGPKGVGALYVRQQPKVRLQAQILGGGQQNNLRSGTLAVPLIIAMAIAARIATDGLSSHIAKMWDLHKLFLDGVNNICEASLNGSANYRVPHNINLSFERINGEALFYELSRSMAIARGSACNATTLLPSAVLQALQLDSEMINNSLRFSMGRYTTTNDIERALAILKKAVLRLNTIMPQEIIGE